MKRVKETLAVLFLSLVLGSCGSLMDNNILLSIHKGMTQEEVTKLLGRPDYRRFDEQGEQWEFDMIGLFSLFDYRDFPTIVIVWKKCASDI